MNEPKLRFKGFEGEWESISIEEVSPLQGGFAFQSTSFRKYGIPIVRISNILNTGEIGGAFIFYKGVVPSQYSLSQGDAVIAMSGATTGKTAVVKDNGFYYLNQRVGKFARTGKIYYPFVATYIQSYYFVSKLQNLLSSSAQPNISTSDVNSIQINVPTDKAEQRKIATYFTHLDTLIEASRQKVEKLKQVKAASLQSFFPTHGERTPNVRFKGFEGDWKKVKFGEVFDFLKNNSLSRAELSDEGFVMNVHYGDVLIKYPEFLDVAQEKMTFIKNSLLADKLYKSCPLQNGDVVIADAAEDETVGKCTELVNVNNVPIVSGLHTIPVRPRLSFASKYLGFFLNSSLFHDQLLVHIQGSKISSISKSAILKTFVYFPSLHEQRLIAQYFTHLDSLLSLERQRYAKLQQVKRASLSQMLV